MLYLTKYSLKEALLIGINIFFVYIPPCNVPLKLHRSVYVKSRKTRLLPNTSEKSLIIKLWSELRKAVIQLKITVPFKPFKCKDRLNVCHYLFLLLILISYGLLMLQIRKSRFFYFLLGSNSHQWNSTITKTIHIQYNGERTVLWMWP